MNDPEAALLAAPLGRHDNPKVRAEALRTMLHYQDPEADKSLLVDLGSADPETQLQAVQLAGNSRSPEVRRRLVDLLVNRPPLANRFPVKKAAVRALSEIGDPDTLPDLDEFLRSRSLLAGRNLNLLKCEVIRSLPRYPSEQADAMLLAYAESDNQEVALAASKVLGSGKDRPLP